MSAERRQQSRSARTGLLWGAIAGGLAFLVYAPGITAGFVGDDFMILHRLRNLTGPGDAVRFFRGEFFEYYRPLGFVAHAADYAIAGANPAQFHFTNILLHTLNTILVLLLGRRLSPDSLAGPLAALLFGLHASNHEAVMWISARFDLLATSFGLAALLLLTRHDASVVWPAFLFGLAVLTKESGVALPLAAAGWAVFRLQAGTGEMLRRVAPWLVALAIYTAMRTFGGGVPATGGAGRLPKLVALFMLLSLVVVLADGRWIALRNRLARERKRLALATGLALALLGLAAALSTGAAGRLAAEKLAVAGFAIVHLVSPIADVSDTPFYLNPASRAYWLTGLVMAALAAGIVFVVWHRLLSDGRVWFLAAFFVAALLPISALTEGKRYLYLPSAAMSLLAGMLVAELRGNHLKAGMAAAGLLLATSAVEIVSKVGDWKWAGVMTAEGASLVDRTLAPGCGTGHVVFLTSPVGIRGVYNHFYYETFELARGCRPEVFQVLVRVLRSDTSLDVRRDGPERIVLTAADYTGNFVLSEDLRHFDRPLPRTELSIETPLGLLRAEPFGEAGQRLTLTLRPELRQKPPHFFYYSEGRIRPSAR